ncbi:fibronectin type III domain-containing protein [Krasilnikovia sp. MM14-A1004]|uniref:RCC1 domain-containing protein n=1 Tax=Krasilnikovia sp. MM14-A1004 TaxID=3373541 RepID=UPI00399CE297
MIKRIGIVVAALTLLAGAAGMPAQAVPTGAVTQVTVGGSFTCALRSGRPYCWGHNDAGKLGDGTTTSRSNPVPVSRGTIPSGVTLGGLTAGGNHACGLGSNGRAYCWGDDSEGQLGDGSSGPYRGTPAAVTTGALPGGVTLTRLSAGFAHTCGLGSDDWVYCWGFDGIGQLGDGGSTSVAAPVAVAAGAIPGGVTFTQVSSGSMHTCGLGSDGQAYCWGRNVNGQLGDGTTTDQSTPVAVAAGAIPGGVTLTQIASGNEQTCGLGSNGRAYCWGYNGSGELGDGTTTGQSAPVEVAAGAIPGGVTLTGIASGIQSNCGLGSNGHAYCWGDNTYGQVGDGSTTNRSTPVAVAAGAIPGGVTLTQIAGGGDNWQRCALGTDGHAYCWGLNFNGQLGDGSTTDRSTPVPVSWRPQAPTGVILQPGDRSITVSWTRPADLAGGTLTGYTATTSPGGATCTTTATTCTITGLTADTWYTATVVAATTAGTSPASTVAGPVAPFALPDPPVVTAVRTDDGAITVSWRPGDPGSGTPLGYAATAAPASDSCPATGTPCVKANGPAEETSAGLFALTAAGVRTCTTTDATTCTITGLANGATYAVTVVTRTTAGDSAPAGVAPALVPEPTEEPSTPLSTTGAPVTPIAATGLALTIAGAALALLAHAHRRRRTAQR